MKRYIRRNRVMCSTNGKYIGGKLFDLPEEFWDDEDDTARIERTEEQDDYIHNFSDNYIIYWDNGDISVNTDLNVSWDIVERMAVKEGVDVIAYPDHIDIVGYYGRHQDVAHLYPISEAKADELVELVDNSDYDETTTLESYISQYAYNGASIEDVIRTWR